jgi:hypothetical protein
MRVMHTPLRLHPAACLLALLLAAPATAQTPRALEPLPEVPPPPQMTIDPSLEPQITIKQRGTDKIEEFRVNGKLYMVRVTPPGGTPYILIDQAGGGNFMPSNGPADPLNFSVPMWVIKTF